MCDRPDWRQMGDLCRMEAKRCLNCRYYMPVNEQEGTCRLDEQPRTPDYLCGIVWHRICDYL